jgi:hypothetical protein
MATAKNLGIVEDWSLSNLWDNTFNRPDYSTFNLSNPVNYTPTGNLVQGSFNLGNVRKISPTTKSSGLQSGLGYADIGLKALGVGADLASAWTGYQAFKQSQKAFDQSKKQFAFEKALNEKNLANQAQLINNYIDASANVASGLSGKTTASSLADAALRDKYMSDATARKVSGKL